MAYKTPSQTQRAHRMLNGLAEHIENATGEQLMEDARREEENPDKIAIYVKSVLLQAVRDYQRRELKETEEGYEHKGSGTKARHIEMPRRTEDRRAWLAAAFNQQPQLQVAATMGDRDLSELTDEDLEALLRKLGMLGILRDLKLPEK